MSEFVEKVKEFFEGDDSEEKTEVEVEEDAEHVVEDGKLRGWTAAEVDPSEYVDDDWVNENTKEV